MQLNISQQMKMSQQMKLAPRMIQSMEILQLPVMALKERIDQELSENILLEQAVPDTAADMSDSELQFERDRDRDDRESADFERKELVVDNDKNNEADFERLMEMSKEWPDHFSSTNPSANRIDDLSSSKHDTITNIESRPESLQENLLEQFHFFNCSPAVREFGEFLIQNLDDNGRLPVNPRGTPIVGQNGAPHDSLQEMIEVYSVRISPDDAQTALSLIQKLEPRGVGARDLKECLLLQIDDDTPYRDVLIALITSHLDDLYQNRLPVIERKTGYSLDVIKEACEQLKHLNPWPGRGFDAAPAQSIVPDVYIEKDDDGKYTIRLEREYTPNLTISRKYQELLAGDADAATKEYVKRKINAARWIIDAVEQRYSTLKRVSQAIVDHQTEFLDKGPEYIVPLKMEQIADVVGVHVTTVSRAVDDKYIQTPRSIIPLKRFFGGGTTNAEGEEVAWDVIRIKLREIVDAEDKSRPLSDDALVDELAKHGYKLARRTITKYRKAMDIPSSRQRREY
ncbi:RNA polymerase sigma-54 factor [Symmachiella dynata]|uniref:RNA polymerase sigma-54 factor n=1 Tax=Symmachiella dynata TaxID=2527995 RepID=A0A517ZU58_9PLAN|nr:RNA polymerase factor sigma-54 [Symmachiella dynata]QDU45999.1 RNA polymerase sigma-54 factor [Symmachiella dynata]